MAMGSFSFVSLFIEVPVRHRKGPISRKQPRGKRMGETYTAY